MASHARPLSSIIGHGQCRLASALNTAVSLHYYVRLVRAMFIDEPVGDIVVRPRVGYQIMLGAFSAPHHDVVTGGT